MSQVPIYPPIPSPLPADAILYAVTGGTPGVPDVGSSGHFIAEQLLDVTAVSETWDMSATTSFPTVPSGTNDVEATSVEIDPQNYEMTPVSGVELLKQIGSVGGIQPTTDAQQMRIFAPNTGGDFAGCLAVIVNSEATAADVFASVMFGGAVGGTVTHIAIAFFPYVAAFGPGSDFGVTFFRGDGDNPSGSTEVITNASFALTPGVDDLFLSFDGTLPTAATVTAIRSSDGGATITDSQLSTLTLNTNGLASSFRLAVGQFFTSGVFTFPDVTMNFDFSAAATGGVPFAYEVSTPPVDARDGRKYLVTNGGQFAGKQVYTDDVVEFRNGATDIVVYRLVTDGYINALIAAYNLANPELTLLMEALQQRRMWGAANDYIGWTAARGDSVLIGQIPAGAFAGMTNGNIAVYDGATWIEYAAALVLGVEFHVINVANFPGRTLKFIGTGAEGFTPGVVRGLFGTGVEFADDSSTFDSLLSLGWLIAYPQLGALTNNRANFPGESLPATIRVGAVQSLEYSFNADSSVDIQSNTDIGSVSAEAAFGVLFLELRNNGGVPRTITFTLPDGNRAFRFVTGQVRRFIVVRLAGGGTVTVMPLESPAPWTAATLLNSWVNTGSQVTQYRRNVDTVELSVSIGNGTAGTLFTLPVSMRPVEELRFPVAFLTGGTVAFPGIVAVLPTGDVVIEQPTSFGGSDLAYFNVTFGV